MILGSCLLLAALTRAEVIERFRASPVTQAAGLVQVWGDCSKETRREYQLSVAGFAGDLVKSLFAARNQALPSFATPGIVLRFGETETPETNVLYRAMTRENGAAYALVGLPDVAHADLAALRRAVVRGFSRAVDGRDIDEKEAEALYRAAVPELRLADRYADLRAWRAGERPPADDEKYLKLQRSVLAPGRATEDDVLLFAARLHLYSSAFGDGFGGVGDGCSFAAAIPLARTNAYVRLAALEKARVLNILGGGHGPKFDEAVKAYQVFLLELARGELAEEELRACLAEAEGKLKGTLE